LIKNKKILSDLLEKEKEYGDNEDSKYNANREQSTDSEEDEEIAPDSSHSQESENSHPKAESDNENSNSESPTFVQEKELNPCQHCEGLNVYHTAVMNCPKCFWHDNREICPVCGHSIPIHKKTYQGKIKRCFDCGAVTHYDQKGNKIDFLSS